jgi:hypothetical protein
MNASRMLLVTAWTGYVVAWFLPVVEGGSNSRDMPGYGAFVFALAPLWDRSMWDAPWQSLLMVLSALTNLAMIASWVAVRIRRHAGLRVVSYAALASFAVNSHWFFMDRGGSPQFKIGYFLWWWSFLPLAIGALLLRRQVAATSE